MKYRTVTAARQLICVHQSSSRHSINPLKPTVAIWVQL